MTATEILAAKQAVIDAQLKQEEENFSIVRRQIKDFFEGWPWNFELIEKQFNANSPEVSPILLAIFDWMTDEYEIRVILRVWNSDAYVNYFYINQKKNEHLYTQVGTGNSIEEAFNSMVAKSNRNTLI